MLLSRRPIVETMFELGQGGHALMDEARGARRVQELEHRQYRVAVRPASRPVLNAVDARFAHDRSLSRGRKASRDSPAARAISAEIDDSRVAYRLLRRRPLEPGWIDH